MNDLIRDTMQTVQGRLVFFRQSFNEEGWPIVKIEPGEDQEFTPESAVVYSQKTQRKIEFISSELLCWTPNKEEIPEVMEQIFEVGGWGTYVWIDYHKGERIEKVYPCGPLKDAPASCSRCAEEGTHSECMYCSDPPKWALKLEDLGLAYMTLGDGYFTPSGWHWEIYRR